MEGPRVSGPWLVFRGGNAIGGYRPLIYRGAFPFFLSVWDYVPHESYLAGDVDARRASDLLTDGDDRVDPSPRDHRSNTCVMLTLSDGDQSVNQSPRGVLRSARFSSRFDRGIKLHRTDVILSRSEALRGRSGFLAIRGDVRRPSDRWISIGRPAVDSPHDRGARDQTNRDRPSS